MKCQWILMQSLCPKHKSLPMHCECPAGRKSSVCAHTHPIALLCLLIPWNKGAREAWELWTRVSPSTVSLPLRAQSSLGLMSTPLCFFPLTEQKFSKIGVHSSDPFPLTPPNYCPDASIHLFIYLKFFGLVFFLPEFYFRVIKKRLKYKGYRQW